MSVAVCNTTTVVSPLEKHVLNIEPPGQLDIWASIQSQKTKEPKTADEPYVHPLLKRSFSLMNQKSLEICTESLGSETGSDGYFSDNDLLPGHDEPVQETRAELQGNQDDYSKYPAGAAAVNYHCRSPSRRSFPPPLPSLLCRDRPCLQMRPRREDGRLVVEAVAVPSQNYLHAERQNGRLLLSFIKTTSASSADENVVHELEDYNETEEEEQEDEEEEEVEVVDRGTVVEVKVSTQPQQHGTGSAAKIHRSSIVINKFVGCIQGNAVNDVERISAGPRRSTTSTTTAAAAAVAASTLGAFPAEGNSGCFDNKLLFTSKRRNREELLHDMRRCSQLRKPLFIWEPCCIATSSS